MGYKLVHDALHAPGCKATTRLVLALLAEYANEATGECWPAHQTLADTLECDRATVVRSINQLEALGYVRRDSRHGKSLNYRLTIPAAMCCKMQHMDLLQNATHGEKPHNDLLQDATSPVANYNTTCCKMQHHLLQNATQTEKEQIKESIIYQGRGGRPDDDDFSSSSVPSEEVTATTTPPPPKKKRGHEIAIERLVASGLNANEATQKVKAVEVEFKAWRAAVKANGELDKHTHRTEYLIEKLVEMALKGPQASRPATPPPQKKVNPNTRDLDEILGILRDEFARQAEKDKKPQLAKIVSDLLTRAALDSGEVEEWDNLKAIAEAGWHTERGPVHSPLGYVRKTLSQIVEARAEAAAEVDRAEDIETLRELRRARAEAEEVLWRADRGLDEITDSKRAELIKEVEELRARIEEVKERLSA